MPKLQKIKSFLLENKTTRQTVVKNILWLFGGETISKLLKTAIIIYAARILGAENYGVFSYAFTIASLFLILSDIGLSPLLTRESAKNPELKAQYFSTAFIIKIILLIFSIILIIFIAPSLIKIEAAKPLLLITASIFIFDGLREFGFALNRAMEKMEKEALIKIITNFSVSIIGFIILTIYPTPKSLAIAYATGSGIGFMFIVWIFRSYIINLISNFNSKLVWPLISTAWPFAVAGLLGAFLINTDIIMLGWFRDAREVGFYSAAQRPIQFFYLIPGLIITAIFPVLTKSAQTNNKKARQILEKSLTLVLLIAFPLTIGGIILSKELIVFIFGNEYFPAITTFSLLLTTLITTFSNIIIDGAIFAYNKQKLLIIFLTISATSNIIMNLALIPSYGMEGSAIATVIASIFSSIFIWYQMKKINYFSILPYIKKIIWASIAMATCTLLFKHLGINLLLNLLLSAGIYFYILIILKESILREIKDVLNQ